VKISNPDTVALSGTSGAAATGQVSSGSRSRKGAGGTASDYIEISSLGDQLRTLLAASPERSARIAQLESAVTSGRYRPDAGAVSSSIIQDSMTAAAAA
jgi:flagellar biosynthesis anti-sigma factor FlgM